MWKYVENTSMPLHIKITELSRVYTKVIALLYVDVAEPLRIIIREKTLERWGSGACRSAYRNNTIVRNAIVPC